MSNKVILFSIDVVQKLVLVFCVIGFVSGKRSSISEVFFWFDGGLVFYIMSSMFLNLIKDKKNLLEIEISTFKAVIVLLFVLLPSFLLVIFSNNLTDSLSFLLQYLFLIIVVPLFLDSVYRNGHMDFLLKSLFIGLIVVSFVFLGFYLGFTENFLFSESRELGSHLDSKLGFGNRFTIGEFTPNEMGHYFVLLVFLMTFIYASNNFKIIITMLALIPYLLTFSKTVWIQMLVYFMIVKSSIWRWTVFSLFLVYVLLFQQEIFNFFINDFSFENTSNTIRLKMYSDSLIYIPYSIIFPAYHSIDNLMIQDINVTSVHNGVLSYITNFGLISFLILLSGVAFYLKSYRKKLNFNFFIAFIILDLIVLMFNPLINSRIIWFPLFLYIFLLGRPSFEYSSRVNVRK